MKAEKKADMEKRDCRRREARTGREAGEQDGGMRVIVFTACAMLVYLVRSGIYNNYGVMLPAIVEQTGLAFSSASFVLAVGQFTFGAAQPLSGILADKRGNRFALLTGLAMTLCGVIWMPFCGTRTALLLDVGILLSGGLGLLAFGLITNAVFPHIPARRQPMVSGVVNAASGIGNTLLTPLISASILAGGLLRNSAMLTLMLLIAVPAVWLLTGKPSEKAARSALRANDAMPLKELLCSAFQNRDYIFIVAGFFTCGFHMCIIMNHLYTEIVSFGYAEETASRAFSIYGIATLAGAIAAGIFCARFRMKNVLGTLYGVRVIAVVLFLVLPKTLPAICLFIIAVGATGAATVTPVNGICGQMFGARGRSILFGIAFVAHQIGGFLSSWLGGILFEARGSYADIWIADAVLCAGAAAVSFLISKRSDPAAV